MDLQLINRVVECEENGWHDLLSKLDQIVQSLIDNPPEEHEIIMKNPIMDVRQAFGQDM